MRFSIPIRTAIFAVAGSLAILPECNALYSVYAGSIEPTSAGTTGNRNRQLKNAYEIGGTAVLNLDRAARITRYGGGGSRTLTSVEEAKDEQTQHSLHINATGLPTSCLGCTVAIALIQTYLCSTTDAYDSALKFSLQDALTYVTNENGSTGGWKTNTFRELLDSNNNSTMPLSLVDALNPATSTDSKVAVYLYDMEENPIACATFEQASEEEAAMYEELFYGESESGEGEDDGPDAAAINPLENDTSSASGGLELVSAFVAGVSLFASAILVFV
mmetsp:Transcript_36505/g.74479  ORF Transcript_36505/g.74479 Transcript_36505/m.74479 type:complete len:275 (+) Transcript_36505:96-920(+)